MPVRERGKWSAEAIRCALKLYAVTDNAWLGDVECALAVGADGVHVGQDDMACERARALLGPDAIVGVSTQTVEQARAAEAAGADYLGVGGVTGTAGRPDTVGALQNLVHGRTSLLWFGQTI